LGEDKEGKPVDIAWSGPEDGTMDPTMEEGKASWKQSAKKDGDAIRRHGEYEGGSFESNMALSEDGNTMVDNIVDTSKDGKVTKEKEVFHRVGKR
jgi:hypothetical protein